jgi:RHS repeat-associated protein
MGKCEFRDGNDAVTLFIYPQGQHTGATKFFYSRDHLGSIREMLKSDGTVVGRYDYDPWGRSTTVINTTLPDFNFTGLYRHSKSNLDLAVRRFYDPDLGRWLSRDPSGESGGLNLYSYGANNPANLTDLVGLCPQDWWDLATWIDLLTGHSEETNRALEYLDSTHPELELSNYYVVDIRLPGGIAGNAAIPFVILVDSHNRDTGTMVWTLVHESLHKQDPFMYIHTLVPGYNNFHTQIDSKAIDISKDYYQANPGD